MEALNRFLSFVEVKTKLASVVPFFTGLAYALYVNKRIDPAGTLVFFAAMLLFDMTATAINNHIDARRAGGGSKAHYSNPASLALILSMLVLSAALGLVLTAMHGLVVLAAGVICFVTGILYTFGPVPVSKTPYGEALSGFVMGFFITFIAVYVNLPKDALISLPSVFPDIVIDIKLAAMVKLGLVAVPLMCGIANIMLANNICDLESDIKTARHTLPHYIGIRRSLALFAALYYIGFGVILALSAFRVIPYTCILGLAGLIPVRKNIAGFYARQVKSETFNLSVINFMLLSVPYFILIFIGCLFF